MWRVVLLALTMGALGLLPIFLIAEPLTALHKHHLFLAGLDKEGYDRVINIVIGPILTAMIAASIWLAGRWLDHRQFSDFGLRLNRQWWADLLFGLALGAGLMGMVFLWEYHEGWVTVTGTFQTTVMG